MKDQCLVGIKKRNTKIQGPAKVAPVSVSDSIFGNKPPYPNNQMWESELSPKPEGIALGKWNQICIREAVLVAGLTRGQAD